MGDIRSELAKKAEQTQENTKLTKSMSIADLIKAMEPEIQKALPSVITPERFTRMALSALNTTPKHLPQNLVHGKAIMRGWRKKRS